MQILADGLYTNITTTLTHFRLTDQYYGGSFKVNIVGWSRYVGGTEVEDR